MKFLILFLCFVQFLCAKDTLETLRTMKFEPKVMERLEVVMADYYAESSAYLKNTRHIRDKMLIELQRGENVDFSLYEKAFKQVSDQYIKFRIKFYRALIEILGSEKANELIENLRN